jgi:hypothetical protein
MRNTLQEQYNLLKEGKMNKQHFFKSARHLFPDLITPTNSFTDAVTILKNRGIISEGIGGLVTTGKKQDWHAIFNENIAKLKENTGDFAVEKPNGQILKYFSSYDEALAYVNQVDPEGMIDLNIRQIENVEQNGDKSYTITYEDDTTKTIWTSNDAWDYLNDKYHNNPLMESKEAKAEEKETTKEVTDMATRGYDYKDEKNYDNVFGQEFLQGYYTEMKDPKNADKHVDELRAIVAKNLAKDINHYVKDGQFGVKGLGYTTEAPGLGEPKEAKGKYKSSGYGNLEESVLRLAIQDIIKEVLTEISKDEAIEAKKGDTVTYKQGDEEKTSKIVGMSLGAGDPLPTFKLENGEEINAKDVLKLNEALNMEAIKLEGENAKKKVMERRITNEIVKRKKQIKALETLTELEEESGGNTKKVKELQSEIKKLEGAKAKLDGKKKEKKTIEEEIPQMKNIEDEEAKKEVELANILTKKANLLKQPGTQS